MKTKVLPGFVGVDKTLWLD